jgi:hypothetical protein
MMLMPVPACLQARRFCLFLLALGICSQTSLLAAGVHAGGEFWKLWHGDGFSSEKQQPLLQKSGRRRASLAMMHSERN